MAHGQLRPGAEIAKPKLFPIMSVEAGLPTKLPPEPFGLALGRGAGVCGACPPVVGMGGAYPIQGGGAGWYWGQAAGGCWAGGRGVGARGGGGATAADTSGIMSSLTVFSTSSGLRRQHSSTCSHQNGRKKVRYALLTICAAEARS